VAKYKHYLGLGIAGNFALHLDQAGEAEDFKDVITADEAAPKGMFPFYIPDTHNPVDESQLKANKILHTYPISAETLKLPNDEALNVQAEPEVALVCELHYTAGKISNIVPTHFGAYNDASIRVKGAKKISDKKNWGHETKGFSNTLFKIDKFEKGGIMDNFSICSFLKRDAEVHMYGENAELLGYSYFYDKLTQWMINQINTQEDFGPLEPIEEYIIASEYPSNAIISIGATRYTQYGENTFLQMGDEIVIVVYNHTNHTEEDILQAVKANKYDNSTMSVLSQKVIHKNSNE
jgi:hypothetical protein